MKQYLVGVIVLFVSMLPGASAHAVGVSVDGGVAPDVTIGASSSASLDAETNVTGSVPLTVITVTRADVEGGAAAATSFSPTTVRTNADLSGFVAAQIASDEGVSKVEASSDEVSVTYSQIARLFGFIPVTVDATATVQADGTVDVRYPWYAFLLVTNETDLEADIRARVEAIPLAEASASEVAEFSASMQAVLVNEVRAVMESEFAASVAAYATANANVE